MNNGNKPIHPMMMQQVGENEFRASRDNDPKEWRIPMEGLTKREYFAGAALQGLVANTHNNSPKFIAEVAVKIADELLNELEKTK